MLAQYEEEEEEEEDEPAKDASILGVAVEDADGDGELD